jgi:hypothetical protein
MCSLSASEDVRAEKEKRGNEKIARTKLKVFNDKNQRNRREQAGISIIRCKETHTVACKPRIQSGNGLS